MLFGWKLDNDSRNHYDVNCNFRDIDHYLIEDIMLC